MRYNPLISKNTPNNWQVKRLEEVSNFVSRGKQPKYVELSNIYTLNQKAIRWGSIQHENLRYHNPDFPVDEKYFIKKNDIVLNSTGVGTVGRVFHFAHTPKVRMFADSHVTIIRSEEEVLRSKFLYYQLSDVRFQSYILNTLLAGSTGQVELNKSKIMGMEILIPTIEEQDKIVDKLRYLDSKIELNNQIISNLEELASTLFKRWFVDFEFPDENGSPYKSSGGTMIDSELGEIPDGWRLSKIGEEVQIVRGASPRPIQEFMSDSSGRPWVKISDANSASSCFINRTKQFIIDKGISRSRTVEPGTLILSNSATPGIPKFMDILASVHDGWLIFNDYRTFSKEFLYLLLLNKRKSILSLSNGSVFRNLKTDILKKFPVVVPNEIILRQAQILYENIFKIILHHSREITTLEQLRDSLLPKLLSGEIELPEDEEV